MFYNHSESKLKEYIFPNGQFNAYNYVQIA